MLHILQSFFIKFSSFYWFFFIYAIHNQLYLQCNKFFDTDFNNMFFILFLFLIGLSLGGFSLYLLQMQGNKRSDDTLEVERIVPIYREFTPIFLTFIIIAFNLKCFFSFEGLSLSIFIFVFFCMNNTEYLNPIFYILRWKVYKLETKKSTYMLVTNNSGIKGIEKFSKIKKINEYTFFIQNKRET